MTARLLLSVAAGLVLTGCGSGSPPPTTYEPQGYTTTPIIATLPGPDAPLTHTFPEIGKYEATVRGTITCSQLTAKTTISVYLSFGGASALTGEAYNDFPMTTCNPLTFERTANVTLFGEGPWVLYVRTFIKEGYDSSVTARISDLTLTVRKAAN